MLSSRKSLNQLKCYAEDVKDAIDESPLPPIPPNSLCDNGKIMIVDEPGYARSSNVDC